MVEHSDKAVVAAAFELAGLWKRTELADALGKAAGGSDALLRNAAIGGLQSLGGEAALAQARRLMSAEQPFEIRRKALGILAKAKPSETSAATLDLLNSAPQPDGAVLVWRALTSLNVSLAEQVAKEKGAELSKAAIAAGLTAAQEQGRKGANLVKTLKALTASSAKGPQSAERTTQEWAKLVQGRGNAAKGERIYHSASMACIQCHAIGGAGGKFGPDMSTLGASAPLDYVIESVLVPSAKVKEGYHGVSYTLTDGGAVVGIPFEENGGNVRVRMPGGLEMDVPKAKIKSTETLGSLMPQGLVDALSEEDKINLFAFLGSVGRPGAFDTSNGGVARAWKLVASAEQARKSDGLNTAPTAYSLTDGRLPAEHLQAPLGMVQGADKVFAVTKLAVGNAAKVRIEVEGSTEFWIDGTSVSGSSVEKDLPAGTHTIAVALTRSALPAQLKATATQARFIAP